MCLQGFSLGTQSSRMAMSSGAIRPCCLRRRPRLCRRHRPLHHRLYHRRPFPRRPHRHLRHPRPRRRRHPHPRRRRRRPCDLRPCDLRPWYLRPWYLRPCSRRRLHSPQTQPGSASKPPSRAMSPRRSRLHPLSSSSCWAWPVASIGADAAAPNGRARHSAQPRARSKCSP